MAMHMPATVKLPAWRRRLLLVLVLLGFAALLGRGVYLQSYHKRFLQEKGDARYSRTLILPAQRGKITDRYGELLAVSSPVESVWANPSDVKIDAEQTKQIADLLQLNIEYINQKLANGEREFVYLKRRISPELGAQVMKLGIPGVYLQREYKRYYPAGDVTAHLVGFNGIEDKGEEGFEYSMNTTLSGKDGSRRVIKDRSGHIIEDLVAVKVPQDGRDVVLSIGRQVL